MKREKNLLMIIMILSVVIILEFVAIILMANGKSKLPETNVDNDLTNNNINDKVDNGNFTIECSIETEETEQYSSMQKYILNVSNRGNINNYISQYIFTYKNDDVFNKIKELEYDDNITFDDKNKQMINSSSSDKFVDDNGEQLYIWYFNFKTNLEKNGYTCLEK